MTYRASAAFLAVRSDPSGPSTFVTIQAGSIITVKGEALQSGLVDVLHNGQTVAAFMRDIESRAERLQDRVGLSSHPR